MLIPQEFDFTIYQGSTLRLSWEIVQAGTTTPIDLTGYTARMQARAKLADTDTILDLTTENGGITITVVPEKTTIAIYADAATTAAIPVTKGVYDMELVDTSGDVYRLMHGTIAVSREVTR